MADELRVFPQLSNDEVGYLRSEMDQSIYKRMSRGRHLRFVVNELATRAEVLQWYIELNTGGTPHADAEIARVRSLLEAEREKV